jgi:hypothetical protein
VRLRTIVTRSVRTELTRPPWQPISPTYILLLLPVIFLQVWPRREALGPLVAEDGVYLAPDDLYDLGLPFELCGALGMFLPRQPIRQALRAPVVF